MKKILLSVVLALCLSTAFAAQQPIPYTGDVKWKVAGQRIHDNFTDLYTNKANTSCFANAAAFNACFTLDWQSVDASGFNGNLATTDDTLQEIAQKVDDLVLGGGSGVDAFGDIVSLWASGSCTGYLYSDGTCSTPPGNVPAGTEGQTIQYNSSGQAAAVNLAPLAFTDNVSRNTTTGVVSVPVTGTATSGSAIPFTSGGAYTALGGKENADSTIVKVAEIDTQAEFEALVGWPLPSGGTGGYVTPPVYSDSACTVGTYSFHATYGLIYCKATNTWDYQVVSGSSLVWAAWNSLTPVTHSLTITPSGFTGADKFTYNSTDYTTEQVFPGLTADASFTVTPDTGRAIACTGTGLTDNTGGSYTANTDTANVVATCTSSAAWTINYSTFVSGDLASFTVFDSKVPTISGGTLHGEAGTQTRMYHNTSLGSGAHTIEIVTSGNNTTSLDGIGLLADVTSTSYYVAMKKSAVDTFSIYKRVNDVETKLIDAPANSVNGTWKLIVNGTSAEWFFNGTSIGTVSISGVTAATKVGVISIRGNNNIDAVVTSLKAN